MATGILPLVTGSFTRIAQFYLMSEKTYEGTIRFGFSTDTYDAEGEPTTEPESVTPTMDQLQNLAAKFRGILDRRRRILPQKDRACPPRLARKRRSRPEAGAGGNQELNLRRRCGSRHFRARVGSGTYMCSAAHDMGQPPAAEPISKPSAASVGAIHAGRAPP
jgi:tRNA pseudouridine55 synthase